MAVLLKRIVALQQEMPSGSLTLYLQRDVLVSASDMITNFTAFEQALQYNVSQRSRTAQGKPRSNISPLKYPLLLEGEAAQKKVKENVSRTADILLDSVGCTTPNAALFETWYDALNRDLVDFRTYAKQAERLRKEWAVAGKPCVFNYRYRAWPVHYDTRRVEPWEIHKEWILFITQLGDRMQDPQVFIHIDRLAELLAWADWSTDRIIHPWVDACGRFSTALVMWLWAHSSLPHPAFKSHGTHYEMIADLKRHTQYMKECM
jgi:hypothetical protein